MLGARVAAMKSSWQNSCATRFPSSQDEERYLCEAAKIELPKVQRFIQLCKVAIGKNKLHRVLAEIKVDVVEGRGIHNPTGTFVWRLLKLISEPARPLNKSGKLRLGFKGNVKGSFPC